MRSPVAVRGSVSVLVLAIVLGGVALHRSSSSPGEPGASDLVASSALSFLPGAFALAASSSAGIGDFMIVVHGPDGLRAQIQQAAESSGPLDAKAWKGVKARALIIKSLNESILMKGTPEKGSKASWTSMVKDYSKLVDALAKACEGENIPGIKDAVGKISKSCNGCHKAHK